MPSVPFRLAALLLVATTAFATPYPTNMDLLVETVSSAAADDAQQTARARRIVLLLQVYTLAAMRQSSLLPSGAI